MKYKLLDLLTEYKETNKDSLYEPVAVGKYGIRKRNEIYKKELSDDYSKNKVIRTNTLIVGMGSNQIDIGVLSDDKIYSVSPAYHTYRINIQVVDSDYLDLLFKANNANYFRKYSIATARQGKKIDLKSLLNEIVDIPSFEEQGIIVGKIFDINELIRIEEKSLSLLDELTKSRFIEMFGDPTTNPYQFPIISLSNVFDIGSSKRVYESQWTSFGVPFYRAREIVSLSKNGFVDNALFITEEMYQQYKSKYGVPKENDMMVTGVGTLGVCYIVKPNDKFYFKDGNTLWFKNKGLCNIRFIKELFETDFVKEQISANANASTVGTYTIAKANNTKIIYPSINLQNKFAEFAKLIDKLKFNVQQRIEKYKELLDKKMSEYFN